jgi:hypothetical protein
VAEGFLELPLECGGAAPQLRAVDAQGRGLPVHVEVESPGILFGRYELPASAAAGLLKGFPSEFFGEPVCALTHSQDGGRDAVDVWLGEAAPAEFDWERARGAALAELAAATRRRVPSAAAAPRGSGRGRAGSHRAPRGGPRRRSRGVRGGFFDCSGPENALASRWMRAVSRHAIAPADRRGGCAAGRQRNDRGDTYTFDPLPGGGRRAAGGDPCVARAVVGPSRSSLTPSTAPERWRRIAARAR